MAKRMLNRKDLRAAYDAAERRKIEEDKDEAEDGAETEDEEDDEEEAQADEEADDEAGDEDEEEAAPKKRKPAAKAKVAKPKPKPKSRSRSAKVARLKVVWGVFNNSNQCVATFDYPRRQEADDLVAKLTAEKKNTHFVQPVKEPMEEKKDK